MIELESIFTQADDRTRAELLALGCFFTWRRNRSALESNPFWTRRHRWQQLILLVLGGWVYWRCRRIAKPGESV